MAESDTNESQRKTAFLDAVAKLFPKFAKKAKRSKLEHVLPPATDAEIRDLETRIGLPLPDSYKKLLSLARGFWLRDGSIQFSRQHPFFHNFPPLESLTPAQQRVVVMKGGSWPPASHGMLCFTEFFLEADGDQALFNTNAGFINGEYPIVYWAHEGRPPHVRQLAGSFAEFMEELLSY